MLRSWPGTARTTACGALPGKTGCAPSRRHRTVLWSRTRTRASIRAKAPWRRTARLTGRVMISARTRVGNVPVHPHCAARICSLQHHHFVPALCAILPRALSGSLTPYRGLQVLRLVVLRGYHHLYARKASVVWNHGKLVVDWSGGPLLLLRRLPRPMVTAELLEGALYVSTLCAVMG